MPKKNKTRSTSSKKAKSSNKPSDFAAKYIKLRTLLDAIEMGSMRFSLSGTSPDEQIKRAEKLIEKLQPVAEKISHWIEQGSPSTARAASDDAGDDPCPDGYYFCYGACLPYPCPPDGGSN